MQRLATRLRMAAVAACAALLVSTTVAAADDGSGPATTPPAGTDPPGVASVVAAAADPATDAATIPTNDPTSDPAPTDAATGSDATTGSAAALAAGPDGATAPAGQVTVIVRSTAGPAAAASAVEAVGGTVGNTLSLIGAVTADVPSSQVAQLAATASVAEVSNDTSLSLTPADGAAAPGGDGTVTPDQAAQSVGAGAAYAAGLDGSGVDVAVLDTGVVPVAGLSGEHTLMGADLSSEGGSALQGLDGFGHGTAMAGIIAAQGPGGFRGVAPGSRVVSVKVGAADGSVDVSQVIAGIDWVVQHRSDPGVHIRVLNLSFGTESTQAADLDPLAYAADVAWRHGIVVVTSVGNDGRADEQVTDPAIDPSLLAVGAADTSSGEATMAPFSSRGGHGRHADVVAPGVHVLSLRDPGSTLDQAFPEARQGDSFFRGSGTSQATAVVSGAVALLLQQRPDLTPDQVKQLLISTAARLPNARPSVQGAGLVNVAAAMAAPTPAQVQSHRRPDGTGSLEAARGGSYVLRDGVPLTGETTVLGLPWRPRVWARLSWRGATWQGATWQGATWQGATWQGATWQGATWQGATWQGVGWAGTPWP